MNLWHVVWLLAGFTAGAGLMAMAAVGHIAELEAALDAARRPLPPPLFLVRRELPPDFLDTLAARISEPLAPPCPPEAA